MTDEQNNNAQSDDVQTKAFIFGESDGSVGERKSSLRMYNRVVCRHN